MPFPKGYLKLNVDVGFNNNFATLVVLAGGKVHKVQGLWFKKAHFLFVLEDEAKTIFNSYTIAKNKNYYKIIIESNCKVIVNAFVRFDSCP